jgi:hypothetical protein
VNCLTDTPSNLTRPRWSTRRSSPKVDAAGAAPAKPSIDGTGGSESRGLRLGSQRSFATYLAGHFARPFGGLTSTGQNSVPHTLKMWWTLS